MFFEFIGYKALEKYYDYIEEDFKNDDDDDGMDFMDMLRNAIRWLILGVALFVCFKRNKGFALGPLLLAYCYPTCYLLYAFATGGMNPESDGDLDADSEKTV